MAPAAAPARSLFARNAAQHGAVFGAVAELAPSKKCESGAGFSGVLAGEAPHRVDDWDRPRRPA